MTQRPEENQPIQLTPAAVAAAQDYAVAAPEWRDKPLRLFISGKGCDGFEYGVSFDASADDDHVFDYGLVTLVTDPETMLFCAGSVIDWVDDERGRGFLVTNPRHKHFRGKFYKRRNWADRLEKRRENNGSLTDTPG